MDIIKALAEELKLTVDQVEKTVALLDEGNTVPFIARYRKEVTGSLDDVALRTLEDRLNYLRKLDERRNEISGLIDAQGKLTPEITAALDRATTLVELEDIYRPYRPKHKTRASVARERGLGPLAELIFEQRAEYTPSIPEEAENYVDEEKGVPDAAAALAGALDIIAEDISNEADYRKMLRNFTFQNGLLVTVAAKDEDSVYKDYYEFSEPIKKLRQHRVLAINRGEKSPAFVSYIKSAFPDLEQHISHNLSPMAEISKYIKETDETAKTIFIGPCTAKKAEWQLESVRPHVDAVLTFEELQALFDSRDIDITELEEDVLDNASYFGRIFARSGGLTDAVAQALKEQGLEDFALKAVSCDGIEACRMALLKKSKNALDANFIEGMACVGGCIGGAGCLTHGDKSKTDVDKYGREAFEKTISDAVSILK